MFNDFFFSKIGPFFEIMCESILELGRPQVTIRRMCIACWIPKVTHTQNMLIPLACSQQQRLQERFSVLRHTLLVLFRF